MSDKEKILIGIIIMLLGSVLAYRIASIDTILLRLEQKIDKIEGK